MKAEDIKSIKKIIKEVYNIPNRVVLKGSERLFGYDKAINEITERVEKLKEVK